ncbi:MAG: 2-amino-4-hydroxy-6-hydroxymethyldihydropteridine diphosphokinase [Longimicrobiales bacterium]
MPTVYLGLGSNLDGRRGHLGHALRRLGEAFELTGVSSVWETDPVGYEDQGRFLNLVARVETDVEPREVLDTVRSIEEERSRERTFRNAPRTLDIDILLYGDRVVDEDELTIPHPHMHQRPFVLVPLLELDTGLEDPRTGERLAALEAAAPSSRTGMEQVMIGERLLHESES